MAASRLSMSYVEAEAEIPLASTNIHIQQAQMARFVADYWRQPVAVNDLGLVAYRGGEYTLDLWGLASQEARIARPSRARDGWSGSSASTTSDWS
jgi:hypothetical protein